MQTATFFITTARSGTQSLHAALQTAYSDLLVAEHEPILWYPQPAQLPSPHTPVYGPHIGLNRQGAT